MNVSRATRICGAALLCAQLSVSASGQQAPPQTSPSTPPPQGQPPQGPPAGRGGPGGPGIGAQQTPPPSPASIERAGQILAEARKAMGGEKLVAVKTILANGQTRRVRGDNLVPIEFEIAIELPDKYVRKDEIPAEESEPTSTGFTGTTIIQYPAGRGGGPSAPGGTGAGPGGSGRAAGSPAAASGSAAPGAAPGAPAGGRAGGPPAPTPEQLAAQQTMRLNQVKQDFARLALGLLASSLDTFPMTFSFAARAEAPQGIADVLDVRGPGNFTLRLFIQGDTHLPVMVSWQAPPTGVVFTTPDQPKPKTVAPGAVIVSAPAAPPASAPQEEKDKYNKELQALRAKTMATPIEYRLYYADYREVEGVKWPFRLRRAIGADTTEETTFDRFRINTKIDPRKFTIPQR